MSIKSMGVSNVTSYSSCCSIRNSLCATEWCGRCGVLERHQSGCRRKTEALRRLYVAPGKLPVPLRWSAVQLDVNVDGCRHGKEVVVLDGASRFVGPDLRQVDDLKCKFTGPLCLIANCGAVGG